MTDKCTSLEGHKWAADDQGGYCIQDACEATLTSSQVNDILNEHASLTEKVERLEGLPSLVPTTWLDPILVGDNAVDTSKCDGQQVEALLLAIKKRLSDALLESE